MKIAAIICSLLLLYSCKQKVEPYSKPSSFIKHDQMVEILFEMELVEAEYQGIKNQDTLSLPRMKANFEGIFAKHSTDVESFKSNYEYYLRAEKMDAVLNDVLTKLNTTLTEVEAEVE
ncbi:MAG: DUF4296 domain-containing protein [Flavobacteriales bacterium]|nr:DUF4296 domain-containing protein [Flavobacteriales bacterium]